MVWQRQREALVQISPPTEKKWKKETGGHWRERSVNERGKKRKRRVEKDKKKNRNRNSLLLTQKVFITDVYMQYSEEFAIVFEDNKADA